MSDPQLQGDADNPYWIVPNESPAPRIEVRYVRAPRLPLWIGGVQSEVLEGLAVARARGGTLFSVSPSQWDAIVEAAGGWMIGDELRELELPPIGDVEIPSGETAVISKATARELQKRGYLLSESGRPMRKTPQLPDGTRPRTCAITKRFVEEDEE